MTDEEIETAMKAVYVEGLRQAHRGVAVRVVVADDVVKAMQDWMRRKVDAPGICEVASVWGFPIDADSRLPAGSIQVHAITTIA